MRLQYSSSGYIINYIWFIGYLEVIQLNYGEKLRYVRELRQLTLLDLSKKCGLSVSYLSDIENSKKRPAMKSLESLAKALSVDSWFFMDDKAVTFDELTKVSGYEPPIEIMEFVASQDKLPYIVLAKKMSEEGLSPEQWELMFNNIRQMMNSIKDK